MSSRSPLECYRNSYQPALPPVLQDLQRVMAVASEASLEQMDSDLAALFPLTAAQPLLAFRKGNPSPAQSLKVGVVFSGGQAPGGHNVIAGLFDALRKIHPEGQLIGFLNGPSGIIKNNTIVLTEDHIASFRNVGGFDLLGSGRTKIETEEQFAAVEKTIRAHGLDGLVIIGGDDSNTNAAFLAEFCKRRQLPTRIVGVPKTIDGDLKGKYLELPFGFDTASKIYAEVIGNILKDALSAKKYYFFIKMMGRSASHLTLECALQTQVNLALIGEEAAFHKHSLKTIVDTIVDLICERSKQGKDYGCILVPEGLIEFLPDCQELIAEMNLLTAHQQPGLDFHEQCSVLGNQLSSASSQLFFSFPQEIQRQLLLGRDPHGNIQLSKIETERLLIQLVEEELRARGEAGGYEGQFNPQPLFCGYEGRSGMPTNFDCNYCYALGCVAALLIRDNASGYLACLSDLAHPAERWEAAGIPLLSMMHFEMRGGKQKAVIQKELVDLQGQAFALFSKERDKWRLSDDYRSPGPVQFEGPAELAMVPPISLM